MTADVVVIGAGFAGLSAAVRLVESGLKVVVVEEAPRLGGRATSFVDRDSGERVDNGQHVLFGCYRDTYAFLRRLGTGNLAPLDRRLELTFAGGDGSASVFSCPAWPPPWHLVGGLLRWKALPLRDRLSALRLAPVLLQVRRDGAAAAASKVSRSETVAQWLDARGQSPQLCRWFWHPLAVAALNQSPEVAAAAPFVRVLGELFGPRVEDSAVGLPRVPLDRLYAEPAARLIESKDGAVLTRSAARIECDEKRVFAVRAGSERVETPVVVSAVPWHAIGRIWDGSMPASLSSLASATAAFDSSPIVTVNLWYDRPFLPHRFVGLIGGAMQWAFDKSAIFGDDAGHLSVVASGAADLVRLDNAALTALADRDLRRAIRSANGSRLLRSVVVREYRASFSLAPGSPARPGTQTPLQGFFLAGDWLETGLPATIESAVVSGHAAAEAVLQFLQCPPSSSTTRNSR